MGLLNFLERVLFGTDTKALDKAMAESEERSRKAAEVCLSEVPKHLNELEAVLTELENCQNGNEEKLLDIGNKIDMESRDVAMTIPLSLAYGAKLTKSTYDKITSLLQKSREMFNKYSGPCFDILAEAATMRLDHLTENVNNYQPELNQNQIN